jgi:hypothetical protein
MEQKNKAKVLIVFLVIIISILLLGFITICIYVLSINSNKSSDRLPISPTPVVSTNEFPQESLLNKKFSWDDPEYIYYEKVKWTNIYSKIGESVKPYTINKTSGCGDDSIVEYLKYEGGMCQIGYWLTDDGGNEIRNKQKLLSLLGSINTEPKAISLLGLTINDLKISSDGILSGHIFFIHEGFLVEVIRKNTFGCGDHRPTSEIYFVHISGEYELIAKEILPIEKTSEAVLCVD